MRGSECERPAEQAVTAGAHQLAGDADAIASIEIAVAVVHAYDLGTHAEHEAVGAPADLAGDVEQRRVARLGAGRRGEDDEDRDAAHRSTLRAPASIAVGNER